jgi:hypothetical protein
MLFIPLAAYGSVLFNRYKAPRPLVELSEVLRRDADIRIGCWQMEHLPSLNFYVQRNVEHLHDESSLAGFLDSRLHGYVFLPRAEWERLGDRFPQGVRVLGRHYDMYHHTEIVVVTNR